MRIVYYYRHLNDPIGSGSHATSLVREWTKAGNEVRCLPRPPAAGALPDRSPSTRRRVCSPPCRRACGTGCATCRTA